MRADTVGSGTGVADDQRSETIAGEGWHPDPFDLAGERWWNGTRWTRHVRGAAAPGAGTTAGAGDAAAAELLRGRPPGWYPWRGEVARWWDGKNWGSARRPFADHVKPGAFPGLKPRSLVRAGVAAVLVLAVTGAVLAITLPGGSSLTDYRARVAVLCGQTFARERADILQQSTAAVSGRTSRSQAVLVAHVLRALTHDSAASDRQLETITPPPGLRAGQQQYLRLERQDRAIYRLVIPRLQGRSGLQALNLFTGLLGRNAEQLQRLLEQLGGPRCSNSPLG